jgi:hypothetical protein
VTRAGELIRFEAEIGLEAGLLHPIENVRASLQLTAW